jgi:hypothetical protein
VSRGRFSLQLDVPPDARGDCQVRVWVAGTRGCAAGAAAVVVGDPRSAAAPADGSRR